MGGLPKIPFQERLTGTFRNLYLYYILMFSVCKEFFINFLQFFIFLFPAAVSGSAAFVFTLELDRLPIVGNRNGVIPAVSGTDRENSTVKASEIRRCKHALCLSLRLYFSRGRALRSKITFVPSSILTSAHCCAPLAIISWFAMQVFFSAFFVIRLYTGTATATRMPIITTTIISSTSVKPFLSFNLRISISPALIVKIP